MQPIPAIGKISSPGSLHEIGAGSQSGKTGNANLFEDILAQTNMDQKASDQAVKDLVSGNTDSVQEVVMSVAKAEMSFQMFMEIRNKLIESYNELMRMQF